MTGSHKHAAHRQAASMLKVQGIISIIFGALGALLGTALMFIFGIGLASTYSNADTIEFSIFFLGSIVFMLMPHVYLIISGIILTRSPEPKLSQLLTIINLIVGAFSNYIVLVFAIISLVQADDYETGYKPIE